MCLFSVVTVTLDCAEDAIRTAKTVLEQDFADYEYIIKDGGSTDGTVDRLAQMGVQKIVSTPDNGIYDAMNQALDLCQGQYVYFLNAGDTFYKSNVLSQFAAEIDPKAAVIYGNLDLFPIGRQTIPPAKLSRYYLFRKNLNHQSWMARLDVYKALGGFDLTYRYVADQHFLWRCVLGNHLPTQYIDVILATFVYGGISTRALARKDVAQERWQLLRQYYSLGEIVVYGMVGLYFLNPLKVRLRRWQYRKLYSCSSVA